MQAAPSSDEPARTRTSFKVGLAFAIVAGVGSPFINFGLAFGGPLLTGAAARVQVRQARLMYLAAIADCNSNSLSCVLRLSVAQEQ